MLLTVRSELGFRAPTSLLDATEMGAALNAVSQTLSGFEPEVFDLDLGAELKRLSPAARKGKFIQSPEEIVIPS